jgi:CheY-like chemotaxis protein
MSLVLVVDDSRDACNAMSRVVRVLGHESISVYSGEEALTTLRELNDRSVDLIILDNMMPGMDGIEVLRTIREDMNLKMPVVMFSAISDPVFQEHARQKGASDYWVKASVNFKDLDQLINRWLPPPAPMN